MIRSLLLIGMLLSPPGYAQETDCDALLKGTPVSLFTKEVMKRIDEGKKFSADSSGSEETIMSAIRWAGTAVLSSIDSYQRVVEQTRSLQVRTTCEQYDITLLECQLEDIRKEINTALGSKRYEAAYKLQSLYLFTDQRLRSFLVGSRDLRFKDTGWGKRQAFDPPKEVWCCVSEESGSNEAGLCVQRSTEDCDEELSEGTAYTTIDACTSNGCLYDKDDNEDPNAICPFSSDYFPPGNDGYGCTVDVLEKLSAYTQAEKEVSILREIVKNLEEFRTNAKKFLDLERQINEMLGLDTDPAAENPDGEEEEPDKHRVIQGCIIGECSDNTDTPCTSDDDCEGGGVCRKGMQECTDDEDCSLEKIPTDFLAWEIRGPFTVERDEGKLMDVFSGLREREPRTLPEGLLFEEEKSNSSNSSRAGDSFATRAAKLLRREQVRSVSAGQGQAEAELFAAGADPAYTIAERLKPVRASGKPLMALASQKTGLRQLVLRFAWFLRRTCIDRDCNLRLDQVMKLANTDACFPFVDGSYLAQTCEDPLWETCLDEAGLLEDIKPPKLNCDE